MQRDTANLTQGPSRRDFMRTGTAAAVGAAVAGQLVVPASVHAAGSDVIRIGLVGCGGRGSGAALNALRAEENLRLVALGDAFKDKLETSYKNLKAAEEGAKVDVKDDKKFVGLDAYKGVIDSSDVVLLATPPHFRPMHLRAAIDAGKHVFCEKPVAVDVPGVKKVIEAGELAKQKKLSIVSGLCYRYDEGVKATIQQIHDGKIGNLVALQGMYLTSGLWNVPRTPQMTDFEWQLRNWLYFTWLSGDHIVEQHIHTIDKIMWMMKDVPPTKATANGGRTVRLEYPQFGHIYDHFDTIYEWDTENGPVRAFCQTRQWVGADSDTSDWAFGTQGTAELMRHQITGENKWRGRKAKVHMYDAEHVALFQAVRKNDPINNTEYMAKSTLAAIMGRLAAYHGKTVYWDKDAAEKGGPAVRKDTPILMESTEDLSPPAYDWNAKLEVPPIAVPGKKEGWRPVPPVTSA